ADGLQLYKVRIPTHVKHGEDVNLACLYDLEGKDLYAIKWYKDGKEFYRYEPATGRPKKSFPQPGIKVNLAASNETHVRLQQTTLRYSGHYMCEISAEAPDFASEQGNGRVHVCSRPPAGHTGGKTRYQVGDRVKVNCTSHRSIPAANLTWFINSEEAALEHLKLWPLTIHKGGLSR
ncbi:uncharacterized protein LOC119091344, partial [Pollicipes pollicipes]|uniref:uncharacterized protein LOC119091344 n=1 Tax=Pollicipes pollicipes TaxID=41117 RepID=UPI0018857067